MPSVDAKQAAATTIVLAVLGLGTAATGLGTAVVAMDAARMNERAALTNLNNTEHKPRYTKPINCHAPHRASHDSPKSVLADRTP